MIRIRMTKAAALAYIGELQMLLHEVATSGVESDHPQVGYVTVQIERDLWLEVKERFGTALNPTLEAQ